MLQIQQLLLSKKDAPTKFKFFTHSTGCPKSDLQFSREMKYLLTFTGMFYEVI